MIEIGNLVKVTPGRPVQVYSFESTLTRTISAGTIGLVITKNGRFDFDREIVCLFGEGKYYISMIFLEKLA